MLTLEVWHYTSDEDFEPAIRPEFLPFHPAGADFQTRSGALIIPLLNGNQRSLLPNPDLLVFQQRAARRVF